MLVSFSWLKEFVRIERSADEIADLLTMGGIEVEAITRVGHTLDKVFTARIVEIQPHPRAEKLSLARINVGDREETVVCGAPNIRVGQVVPYCAPGAVLPSGLEIIDREIRGVRSPGMVCSEKELDLGDDESGILVFDEGTPVGLPLAKALPFIEDFILETSVTPNRGDCLSILGTAREVAALVGVPWKVSEFTIEEGRVHVTERAKVEVPDDDLCPRYVARLVEGVKIGPSPFDVRLRLRRSGVRAISNVVDATNLILLECGQPLHAFDYALLEEARIVVRRCDPGETFITLDGQEHSLPPNALMIRDGKRSVALAGIMGGLNSEISDRTESVLIESACFERFGIRRTAKALGIGTEASFRFERGVDPDCTLWAAHRAAYLIQKLAGGTILAGTLDAYPKPITRQPVTARVAKVNRLLGTNLTPGEMKSCLERLGIPVEEKDSETFVAVPPSWRWDLERDVDIAEEVARIHGFDKIPVSTPAYRSAADRTRMDYNLIDEVATVMNASEFTEVVTMSFISRSAAQEFVTDRGSSGDLSLLNPLSEDYAVMRTSLIPGLLSVAKRNLSFRSKDLKLYEVGKTFIPISGHELPREDLRLGGLATGSRYPEIWHFNRGEVNVEGRIDLVKQVDFYDVKGAIENLLEALGVVSARYVRSGLPFLHPGKSADIVLDGETVGFLGELSPMKARDYDLPEGTHICEILLEPLFIHRRKKRVFRTIPRYPYVERDLSFIVEEKVSGETIKHLISRSGHDIIASVILFDLYRGEAIPKGCQSMAFRIRYQSESRTLTDEEVQEVHSQVVEALIREVGATMRE